VRKAPKLIDIFNVALAQWLLPSTPSKWFPTNSRQSSSFGQPTGFMRYFLVSSLVLPQRTTESGSKIETIKVLSRVQSKV